MGCWEVDVVEAWRLLRQTAGGKRAVFCGLEVAGCG